MKIALLSLFFTFNAMAAIPPKVIQAPEKKISLTNLLSVLKLPSQNRKQILSRADYTSELARLATDPMQSMQLRWRAVTSIGYHNTTESRTSIDKFLISNEWFLRNAAVIALRHMPQHVASGRLAKALNDKSLVVRTSAVESMKIFKPQEHKQLLWQKLNSPENFRKGKSLWIRRHIVEVLSELATSDEKYKFARLLNDRDMRLYKPAMHALAKITGVRPNPKLKWQSQRKYWLKKIL